MTISRRTLLLAGFTSCTAVTDANGVQKTVVKHVTSTTTAPLC